MKSSSSWSGPAGFSNELGLIYAAPVPPDTPDEDQTAHPPPETGPYVITDAQPGRGWTYPRNPPWRGNSAELMPQLPSGHVNRIEVTVSSNRSTQVSDIEHGKFDCMQNSPPSDRYAQIKEKTSSG